MVQDIVMVISYSKVFSRVDRNAFHDKVTWLYGDITLDNFGLPIDSLLMLRESVNVVFHVAATVRFDEPLAKALKINFRATKIMLDIALECKYLEVSLLHKILSVTFVIVTLVLRIRFNCLFKFR